MYWGLMRINSGALFSLYWGLCLFPVLWTLSMVPVYEKGEKILEIFKGTEGPYRIENERPWGVYSFLQMFYVRLFSLMS